MTRHVIRSDSSWHYVALLALVACGEPATQGEPVRGGEARAPRMEADAGPGKEKIQPPAVAENAPPASPRLQQEVPVDELKKKLTSYFAGHIGRRVYIQVDKPLYKPGETIWIKTWDLQARDLGGEKRNGGIRYELINPKGSVILSKWVSEVNGTATNDFVIPEAAAGGQYKLKVTTHEGLVEERPLVVSVYEPPRIKKKLEFVRKAYGAGDEVTATIKIKRPTGEPLGNHPLQALIWLDGKPLPPVRLTTNATGGGLVRFKLPATIDKGDGLLTIMVEDGGVTESISKRIPIILKKLQFSTFPEGGQLVAGLPGRVYFAAKNMIDKPADIEGRVVDDHGNVIAKLRTYHVGLGRIDFTPATGRTYKVEITRPVGVTEKYSLPLANDEGCVLRTYDDFDTSIEALRVGIYCSSARKVILIGMLRENVIDAAAVEVPEGDPAVVYLKAKDPTLLHAQGIVRVTLFDDDLNPLAERLVFRNRRRGLKVVVEPDEKSYTPREQVALTVRTTDNRGKAIAAEVALSIVDDTVVSFADDKTGHMLSRIFLEPELPGKVEEPNFFFKLTEKKSARAMDLLMGTRGYRKFEWHQVLAPPPEPESVASKAMPGEAMPQPAPAVARAPRKKRNGGPPRARRPAPVRQKAGKMARGAKAKPELRKARPARRPPPRRARAAEFKRADKRVRAAAPMDDEVMAADEAPAMGMAEEDFAGGVDWGPGGGARGGERMARVAQPTYAPVRVFPAPDYSAEYSGPRTDFRETIFWAPKVQTNKNGKAFVTFYLSDAVTSFRVFAEGIGGGRAGRTEKVFKSSLPFSMSVKLPLEVTTGDKLLLPLTLTNDLDRDLQVQLGSRFGDLLRLDEQVQLSGQGLAAKKRESLFFPLTVVGMRGKTEISFAADAGGLKDDFTRTLTVVPLGFPRADSRSGTLTQSATQTFDLGMALDGSVDSKITLYASPMATLLSGIEGMIREPYGCFEQTSSSNYPNIMVMQYLKSNNIAEPALIERANKMLDKGYKRLVSFETRNKGYEWFGQSPPHEALTAYGVLEFTDMQSVYPNVDRQMLARTVKWLKSRRDGKGGFKRDPKALDSFGGAKPEITDAYIVYAMTEAGFSDITTEIKVQAQNAKTTRDPYLLALATNTLLNIAGHRKEGKAAAKRLAAMQKKDGSWVGAMHSITRSTGKNLTVETTALTLLALMKTKSHAAPVLKGAKWLFDSRSGHGAWGATQATVLALKALTVYANQSRKSKSAGTVVVKINGKEAGKIDYPAGHNEPLEFTDLGKYFQSGNNEIILTHTGKMDLPYSIGVDYRTLKPANHPDTVVDLETTIDRDRLRMGETVRVIAKISNKTDQGQPMTLVRVGLPGGLTFQNWQLKELMEKKQIAFYETRAREVILYFRDMKPKEVKEIPIDLVATVPGQYTGPASQAYLYYTNDQRVWTDPFKVVVTR